MSSEAEEERVQAAAGTRLVELRVAAAAAAAPAVLASTREERAGWLRRIADRLDEARDELVEVAEGETHLGAERLRGEVARTTGQLRLFADVLEEGSYLEASIDVAGTIGGDGSQEIRRFLRPLGPVAVFSASNFPFAFSVAGGDTASALAAGCPVLVKAHPGHPELSRRTAAVVDRALEEAGAPRGAFDLVEGRAAGLVLVTAPEVRAVAFTGSLPGATALMDAMSERAEPIPFFGELGSLNPVVITPGAAEERGAELAAELVASFTLGGGQFCTKPGLVFAPSAPDLDTPSARATRSAWTERDGASASRQAEEGGDAPSCWSSSAQRVSRPTLRQAVAERVEALTGPTLLTERIADSFTAAAGRLESAAGVRTLARGTDADGPAPRILTTTIADFVRHRDVLLEECFGPLTLLVEYDAPEEVLAALAHLDGSLTATVHSAAGEDVGALVGVLAERSGRVVFGGWPTGVSVTWGQHHGGPWPATTSQHTSVGATAIRRFLRPIAYQGAPASALPVDLTDAGLARLPHRRDGRTVLR
ncbi:aldehyde dehydrogenase (NADP(+)) [Rathayibacter sp. VKM Ac-2856]|uniref:aldehyde dehydrogenase (NADP(+)) n=1 Tax=unclassified Rathayibacter TaxID=2609250 RepID=UPI001564FF1E|nr:MULTISPECIES: aldehyde dehydrogenase (NADP(+)) [unclassified Rathayibacter]NQX05012.1 aldehyde dehydrogenase (NADP(+)) [Rathayibacter sp. VKM Ac-2858]NQX20180.1 aldehyde dehydrogenase (NADP(+)) [Rathayibacter sp. VKM Ac-2856]